MNTYYEDNNHIQIDFTLEEEILDDIATKLGVAVGFGHRELIVRDVITEFLVFTNRDTIPENAIGLIENMAIKRILEYEEAEKTDIKSYTQGNISVTYKDNNINKYALSDSEKKLLNKFVVSKATKFVKRRK
jgi:hypothetical protein